MATLNEISECDKLNKEILNQQDLATANIGVRQEYVRDKINALKTDFKKKDCDKVLILAKLKKVDVVAEKYQELDKIRIETDSYKQRNYRIIFGVVVLLTGVLIVATISKSKS